jgi:hypothetical protein
MSNVYRGMLRDGTHSMLGRNANMLGVRVPPAGRSDILPDASGEVHPGTGGLSVSASVQALPAHRIARRLKHLVSNTSGPNKLSIWRLDDSAFVNGPIADRLVLRLTSPSHGLIEPNTIMSLGEYEASPAATREDWVIDERGN